MPEYLNGIVWLLVLIGPLLILQRSLHREAQAIFLLLTRRQDIAIVLFSLLFFPGILLHETSHYLMALILRVHTGRFSLFPRPLPGGRLQLGYVETVPTDWARDSLIGVAPLLAGGVFVAYAGLNRMGLIGVWADFSVLSFQGIMIGLEKIAGQPDFWIWFYLTFAVSSTMLPSASDRRAWLPVILVAVSLFALSLFAGAGPWLLENLAPALDRALRVVAIVLGISVTVHLVLLLPVWLIRQLLMRVTGLQVVSG